MKKRYILAIAIISIALLSVSSMAETYGDKTCSQGWLIPGVLPLYICNNPDGGMDHSFLTYEAMNAYYTAIPDPALIETAVNPPELYVYGNATFGY